MARANSALGILRPLATDEVPGSVIMYDKKVEPLGIVADKPELGDDGQKRTADGIILNPQPDDDVNDPLNWAPIRRDLALFSLGWHCLLGGGMTPVLAAGYKDVAKTYNVSQPDVALTTGLYMMGLGLGSVFASPLAILYGKRPVYLGGAVIFLLSAVWCALSPSYTSLLVARIFMGFGVSPVEALPSATIAEIFFAHERAFRVGIYTLLLLGGKNLVPLVSAAIIETLGWRWVFWIVAIIVGFNLFLLFLFVPETFWNRTPRAKGQTESLIHRLSRTSFLSHRGSRHNSRSTVHIGEIPPQEQNLEKDFEDGSMKEAEERQGTALGRPVKHAHFAETGSVSHKVPLPRLEMRDDHLQSHAPVSSGEAWKQTDGARGDMSPMSPEAATLRSRRSSLPFVDSTHNFSTLIDLPGHEPSNPHRFSTLANLPGHDPSNPHHNPKKSYKASLAIFNGRIRKDSYLKVMARPFILFAYPAVLWSTVVYALSIGWLIVLSESVTYIYESKVYNFTPLGAGLVYLSPFIGGIMGTAMAGKISDIVVQYMAKKNGGVYEPEFRLVMAIPLTLATTIGLMGYGWSAHDHDKWIVPTIFFGIISFGCSLGSTTAITFVVDSYRQYAGEALVTLNFSKNIFHGLVFSLFFTKWLESDGSKTVFIGIGCIQVACLLSTIPMYLYGKRARAWTTKKDMMSRL